MGRSPCCSKEGLNRGAWTAAEDKILKEHIMVHGEGKWRNLPKKAGLKRCGKSCRLRWLNYLRPDIKRGNISPDEEELIIRLHKLLGNRWSLIAGRLPGRTDNEIKNYWNTNLGKKVHHKHISDSTRKNSNQSHEKNKKNSNMASPAISNTESQPRIESCVVRTKAVRCSKVFFSPQPLKTEPNTSMAKPLEPSPCSGLSLFTPGGDDPIDFTNVGDFCLSDVLNSDFTGLCDFNYSYDNGNDLSLCLDGTLMFSKDMLEDWTVNNFLQPNVASNHHGFASFLESGGDWLAE